jgi:hypothetical protein
MASDAGASEARDGGMVIQLVVHEVGSGTVFPLLTKNNYTEWPMLMRVKLKERVLWVTVDKGVADLQEDMMAMDELLSAMPPEMVETMEEKKTVKEAWDAITTVIPDIYAKTKYSSYE